MEDFEYFKSIKKYFESYFEADSFSFEYGKNFFGFSFDLENCSKKSLEGLSNEKLFKTLEGLFFLKGKNLELERNKGFVKLGDKYHSFVDLGKKDKKINFIFLRNN